jgi:hypothetical protein
VIGVLGDAKKDDAIVWPAGSKPETNTVAKFVRSAPLAAKVETRVDGSFARLVTNDFDPSTLPNGKLQKTIAADQESTTVFKIGQGTQFTAGRVTSFNEDDFEVLAYSAGFGIVPFEDQIEVESANEGERFAVDGDSGALVYNANFRAVGLAFAITAFGGKHKTGFTYVNPMSFVLDQLKVDLLA